MRYILTFLFMFSSAVVAQEVEQAATSSSGWGIYGGIQSMQISGAEDDASDEELDSYSSDRLSSFYIGVWKNTDWTVGTLPVTIGAELGHRGTSSHSIEEDSDEGATGELAFDVDILITYLDLWASVNYTMSDRFNLWVGPMIGINIKDKATFSFDGLEEGEEDIEFSTGFGFDDNDYGIILGAGYTFTEKTSLNFGVYRGLKDHNPGKFNNVFLDIGYSF